MTTSSVPTIRARSSKASVPRVQEEQRTFRPGLEAPSWRCSTLKGVNAPLSARGSGWGAPRGRHARARAEAAARRCPRGRRGGFWSRRQRRAPERVSREVRWAVGRGSAAHALRPRSRSLKSRSYPKGMNASPPGHRSCRDGSWTWRCREPGRPELSCSPARSSGSRPERLCSDRGHAFSNRWPRLAVLGEEGCHAGGAQHSRLGLPRE